VFQVYWNAKEEGILLDANQRLRDIEHYSLLPHYQDFQLVMGKKRRDQKRSHYELEDKQLVDTGGPIACRIKSARPHKSFNLKGLPKISTA
jgi:hypothetical protein